MGLLLRLTSVWSSSIHVIMELLHHLHLHPLLHWPQGKNRIIQLGIQLQFILTRDCHKYFAFCHPSPVGGTLGHTGTKCTVCSEISISGHLCHWFSYWTKQVLRTFRELFWDEVDDNILQCSGCECIHTGVDILRLCWLLSYLDMVIDSSAALPPATQ